MLAVLLLLTAPLASNARVQLSALKATKTPCCQDTLMPGVCRAMYNRDHEKFSVMCRTNPDFSFIQCCQSCHFNKDIFTSTTLPVPSDLYMIDVENMLQTAYPTCIDRHEGTFCDSFVTRSGSWQKNTATCESSALAFRVCRRTCGFCTIPGRPATVVYNSTIARSPKLCQRLA